VYDIRRALLASDAEGVLAHMTPDVQYVQSSETLPTAATRAMIQASVPRSQFDVVRIRALQTSAGRRTRRGRAEFKVFVRGDVQGPFGMGGAGAADSSWSLGFEETSPGVWQVNRITPISFPFNPALLAAALERAGAGAAEISRNLISPNVPLGAGAGAGVAPNESWRRRRFDRKSLAREGDRVRAGSGPQRQ